MLTDDTCPWECVFGEKIEQERLRELDKKQGRGWRDGSVAKSITALPEDPGSVPSTYMAARNYL